MTSVHPGFLKVLYESQLTHRKQLLFRDYISKSRVDKLHLSTHTELYSATGAVVNVLALDRIDYRYVLSGSINGSVSLYDLESYSTDTSGRKELKALRTTNANTQGFSSISSVQWYPEDCGLFIATNLGGELLVYDTGQYCIANQFEFPEQMIYSSKMKAASDSTGPLVAVGLKNGLIHLCDLVSGDSSHILQGHKHAVTSVDWSPIHSYQLCSSSADGTIRVWDVRKGGTEAGLLWLDWRQDHTAVASVDIKRLAATAAGTSAPLVRDGVQVIQDSTSTKPYRHLSTSLASSSASSGSSRGAAALAVGKAHDQPVMAMRYSPDGNYILSAGNDQRLRLWSAHTGVLQSIHYDVPVSSGRHMPYQLEVMQVTSQSTDDLIVLPDASKEGGGGGGDVLLVPMHSADGRATGRLRGHLGPVTAAVYRRPCQQLVTAGRDGLMLLWEPMGDGISSGSSGGDAEGAAECVDQDSWSVEGDENDTEQVVALRNSDNNGSRRSDTGGASSSGLVRDRIMQDINQTSTSQIKTISNGGSSSSGTSAVGRSLHRAKNSIALRPSDSSDDTTGEGINWSVIDRIMKEDADSDDDEEEESALVEGTAAGRCAVLNTNNGSSSSNNGVGGVSGANKPKKTPDIRAGILKQLNKRRKA